MNMEIARRTQPLLPVKPGKTRSDVNEGEGFREFRPSPHRRRHPAGSLRSDRDGIPWGRFWAGFLAVLCVVAVAYPFLPRRFETSAVVVLQPTDQDGQGDRSMRTVLDENAIQSVIDLVASPALADAVIRANALHTDSEFAGAGRMEAMSRLLSEQVAWLEPLLPVAEAVTQGLIRRRLQAHLHVARDKRSYTLRMGYWSASPEKAAALTTALLDAYLTEQRNRKRRSLERLADGLGDRAARLAERHEAAMAAVAAFMAESGLIDTGAGVALDQRLQILSAEAAQARARMIEASVRSGSLQDLATQGNLGSAADVLGAPAILKLKEAMALALSRTAVWASETKAIQDQIALESTRIVTAAKAEAANWAGREALLLAEIVAIRAETVKRRQAEPRLQELQRVAAFDKVQLEEALTRLKATAARDAVIEADADVLAQAEVPFSAAFPRPGLTLLAALMLATLVGLSMIWRGVLDGAKRLAAS